MKILTTEEEIEFLNKARGSYIGHGSSRVVYNIGDNKVIKVAYDEQGKKQNEIESDLFQEYGDSFLAKVFAIGQNVIVEEEVEIPCSFTLAGWFGDADEDGKYTDEMIDSGNDLIITLNDILGDTSDNEQLGIRIGTNEVVAYDYGYMTELHDETVSRELCDFFENDCECDGDCFLNEIVNMFY